MNNCQEISRSPTDIIERKKGNTGICWKINDCQDEGVVGAAFQPSIVLRTRPGSGRLRRVITGAYM